MLLNLEYQLAKHRFNSRRTHSHVESPIQDSFTDSLRLSSYNYSQCMYYHTPLLSNLAKCMHIAENQWCIDLIHYAQDIAYKIYIEFTYYIVRSCDMVLMPHQT